MRLALTGAYGQFGYHARCRLQYHHGHEVVPGGRDVYSSPEALRKFVSQCDAVIHVAGVNKGTDEEITEGNRFLVTALIGALEAAGGNAPVIYASSIQRGTGTVYGAAKRQAGRLLADYCSRSGRRFVEVVLPNLFGEFTRPHYNSFVGTFCVQLANGEALSIHGDNPVELMHYLEAADYIAGLLESDVEGDVRPEGRRTSVLAVADRLRAFHADYGTVGIVPDLRDPFDLRLFNAYRSVLFPSRYPCRLEPRSDNRGSLFECVKNRHGGQVFYSSTHAGITRGNHFHFDKVERFVVLSGRARISVRRIFSDEVHHFDVDGENPCFIDMPTFHAHNITNTGKGELLTLFWTHDFFDPEHPDTYAEAV
ncbi:UDP-2-acetamido-2,6-beta-L-arabino-hexul-4-ose reductase [Mesorhizobium sp. J18]|uniref:polysaccharide biosynthesis C-terminal domain-containing protein n=1 Tax=Mesorhizobium sp. J18 TaxID=935263 RepID=UPI00119B1924|nr:NAD-dependent epimerase/dehydratase family protein [Mesorhizobium sp. J18]TWG94772.1 UDP-2-acetamido-2,6-beta-L-arabino-hexul-4-ose reductase [Mesorhizobium sp. J18]